MDRESLLNPSTTKENSDSNLVLVTTHNPSNPNISQQVKTALTILEGSDRMRPIMENTKIISSKRQPPNLKRILTSAKFSRTDNSFSVTKCGSKLCKCCLNILEGDSITPENGEIFHVKANMDCTSRNVIYLMKCCGCHKTYVGETGDLLRNRMRVHRQQIKDEDKRILNVSHHIANCAGKEPYFNIFPIYKMNTPNILLRREKEQVFIRKLKPSLNA